MENNCGIKVGMSDKTFKRLVKKYSNMRYGEKLKYCIPYSYGYGLIGFTYYDINDIRHNNMDFAKFVIRCADIIKDDVEEPTLSSNLLDNKKRKSFLKEFYKHSKHCYTLYDYVELNLLYGIGFVYYKVNKLDEFENNFFAICDKETLSGSIVLDYLFSEVLKEYNNPKDKDLIWHTIFNITRFVYDWIDEEIYYLYDKVESKKWSGYYDEIFLSMILVGEMLAYNYFNFSQK